MLFLFTEMPFPLLHPSSNTSLYPLFRVQHQGDFLKEAFVDPPRVRSEPTFYKVLDLLILCLSIVFYCIFVPLFDLYLSTH